jgi:sulfatase maturation enzyme AslB (radical SAM superfamily)
MRSPTVRQGKIRFSRTGAHWFDRRTGLNILLDEVEVPRERWSIVPRYVSIALTNACELRCPYCYAPKVPGRLQADEVLQWAIELDQAGTLGVGFGGGEPTAHPDFLQICIDTAERTQMAVTFTTHAHRFSPEMVIALKGYVHFIRVSMDGLGGTYERLRGRTFGQFHRQVELVSATAPFGFNVVVNDETVDELDAIARYAEEMGAAELLLLPEQSVGAGSGISQQAMASLTAWIARPRTSMRLAISMAGATDDMPLAEPFPDERALEAHAHIDAQGLLKTDAYAAKGVAIDGSIVDALDDLRAGRTA